MGDRANLTKVAPSIGTGGKTSDTRPPQPRVEPMVHLS